MALVINYDPSSYVPGEPWLVIWDGHLTRWPTLELAINAVVARTVNRPHTFALLDYLDGSWGIGLVETETAEVLLDRDLLGTYPHSELRYILQTYGQMLPCKYRS